MKKIFCLLLATCLSLSLAESVEAKEPSLSTKPVHVLANDNNKYSAVIMADDSLWIWGSGRSSEDGHAVIVDEPVKVMDNVRSVSAAREYNTYAVITNDNVLWYVKYTDSAWNGRNWEPVRPIIGTPEKIRENVLSYSSYFKSFITTDHELRRFDGENEWVIATDVISATGLAHAFKGSGYAVVHSDGSLWISGINYYGDGQERHEENVNATSFIKIMDDAVSVSGNENTIAVIKKDHSLWMWGENNYGELGNRTTERSLVPVKVLDNVLTMDWFDSTWAAMRGDGSLWMWGENAVFQGETGQGAYIDGMRVGEYVDQLIPAKVLDDVVEFSCGNRYTLAVKSDGSLWGWGLAKMLKSGAGEFIYGGLGVYQISPIMLFDGMAVSGKTAVPSGPSSWADPEVNAAIAAGLVPEHLQKNYQLPVSRGDVARMFINLIEKSSGKEIAEIMDEKDVQPNINAFTDTNDKAVLEANALGIINGVGNSKFDPDGTFTRAQIAAIINRIARVLGVETDGYSHSFTDVSGHWVDTELGWPSSVGIINGVGNNKFDPDADLTTEQAIVIAYRALQVLKN